MPSALSARMQLHSILRAPHVRRVLRMQAMRRCLQQMPDFMWCAHPECGSGQETPGAGAGKAVPGGLRGMWMRCSSCRHQTCLRDVPTPQLPAPRGPVLRRVRCRGQRVGRSGAASVCQLVGGETMPQVPARHREERRVRPHHVPQGGGRLRRRVLLALLSRLQRARRHLGGRQLSACQYLPVQLLKMAGAMAWIAAAGSMVDGTAAAGSPGCSRRSAVGFCSSVVSHLYV